MSRLFLTIINMSISASWIVLAVLLLRFVLKKAPKWLRVMLWGIVAIRLVCPFSIESVLSLIPSAETISPEIMVNDQPVINSGIPIINNIFNPIISDSLAPGLGASANPLQILIPLLAVVWLFGIAALLSYTAISYLSVRRKVRTAIHLRDNIYQCETVASPFVLGIIRPKIYMPFGMSDQDTNHVIAHEGAHIRRRDHFWKPLGFLILTIHWFNPLMWLGYVLLCRDIELACDERVVKELNNEQRADYSQALLNCSVNRRMIAACPLAFGEVGVKERVKNVLSYKKPAFWLIIVAVLALIITSVCLLTDPKTYEIGDLNDDLQVFLDMKVAEHHGLKENNDNFIAVSYDVMKIEKGLSKTSVYAWILYMEYSCENGVLKEESGAHIPTVITVKKNGESYELVEYWQPRDGKYFGDDIKGKFPMSLWFQALDSQRTIERQKAECKQSAAEYFNLPDAALDVNYGTIIYNDTRRTEEIKAEMRAKAEYLKANPTAYNKEESEKQAQALSDALSQNDDFYNQVRYLQELFESGIKIVNKYSDVKYDEEITDLRIVDRNMLNTMVDVIEENELSQNEKDILEKCLVEKYLIVRPSDPLCRRINSILGITS